MRKKLLKWAEKYLENRIKALQKDDRLPRNIVIVHGLEDGSHHVFADAFLIWVQTKEMIGTNKFYWVVFPEHQEISIYHSSEFDACELKRITSEYVIVEDNK